MGTESAGAGRLWIATLLAGFSTATSAITDDGNESFRRLLYVSSCLFAMKRQRKR